MDECWDKKKKQDIFTISIDFKITVAPINKWMVDELIEI